MNHITTYGQHNSIETSLKIPQISYFMATNGTQKKILRTQMQVYPMTTDGNQLCINHWSAPQTVPLCQDFIDHPFHKEKETNPLQEDSDVGPIDNERWKINLGLIIDQRL